ncbi:hypothetical protein [Pseudomonas viridiflava]|uniref:hypothetical protein n=1 Tax=Pseudomonas viridiflava TaxID=33069 RepID=UPI000F07043B|nr:hypothetical protein [Pseudomonas viridiflava]
MKIVRTLLALFLFTCAFNAVADEPYDGIPDALLSKLAVNDYEGAFDSIVSKMRDDQAAQFKAGFLSTAKEWGNYTYSELYRTEPIGSRLVRLTYIIGTDKRPMMLTMTLYKPTQRWDIRGFQFTTKLDEIMKQSLVND